MTAPKKSFRRRPDRARVFNPTEDNVIFAWCKGDIGLIQCAQVLKSSVPAVKRRAAELCAQHLDLKIPSHKPNKKYPKYMGLDGDPISTLDYKCDVGKDKLLKRLNQGYR